ncbi:hypothetical protein O6H91_13G057300 [Diphasiastrum complanatum]|uniref:Uncharacterized protein n=1 Tax=Diphasiastrum complanatum TaxID=34168 RepID=A0ACC2BV07_DIPCM|nr:hypothetical protein O6H91_13G057300 [Diphasiastrum complanatum]
MISRPSRRIWEALLPSVLNDARATVQHTSHGLLASLQSVGCCLDAAKIHSSTSRNNSSTEETSSSESTPLQKQGPYATRIKSRGVIRFDGQEVIKFLQGLTTNDVSQFDEEKQAKLPQPTPKQPVQVQPPVYTTLLNPQGRFLFDMFLYKPVYPVDKLDRTGSSPGSNGEGLPVLFADVDAASAEDLIHHLKKYRLRSKVEIQNISNNLSVWQRFGGGESKDSEVREGADSVGWGGNKDLTGSTAAEGDAHGWRWYTDPRLRDLGSRGVFPANETPPLVEANEQLSEEFYLLWRLEQGIPEGPTEIPTGEALPLEYNLAGLNAISFDKGCYVGQELVARTTHRGVIRKRVMPVNFVKDNGEEAQQAVAPGAQIQDKRSGKKVGTVTTVLGSRGLALMRLEVSQKEAHDLAVDALEPVHVKVVRPKWWPSQWGHEDEQRAVSSA